MPKNTGPATAAAAAKRRAMTHCKKGHPFDGVRKDNGTRFCKTCQSDREYQHRLDKKLEAITILSKVHPQSLNSGS